MVGTAFQGIPRRGGEVFQARYSREGQRRVGDVAAGTYCRDREAHRGDCAIGDGVERGSIRGVWFERGGDSADRTGDEVPVWGMVVRLILLERLLQLLHKPDYALDPGHLGFAPGLFLLLPGLGLPVAQRFLLGFMARFPGTRGIVGSAFGGIAQNRVGLVEQLDVLVSRLAVQVRVIFTYKTAVGAFDFGNRRRRWNFERCIVIWHHTPVLPKPPRPLPTSSTSFHTARATGINKPWAIRSPRFTSTASSRKL